MAFTRGVLTLPNPTKTSDLVNDSNYLAIREYILNASVLSGGDTLIINDLPINAIITRVELMVTTAFATAQDQNNIDILGADSSVLMDADWNDPQTVGNYCTDCYYEITGNVLVVHDMTSITAGRAILRLFVYDTTS